MLRQKVLFEVLRPGLKGKLQSDAWNAQEVKTAYRTLCQRYHPDHATGSTVLFQQMQKAVEILLNEEKRAKYDQMSEKQHEQFEALWNHRFGWHRQKREKINAFFEQTHTSKPVGALPGTTSLAKRLLRPFGAIAAKILDRSIAKSYDTTQDTNSNILSIAKRLRGKKDDDFLLSTVNKCFRFSCADDGVNWELHELDSSDTKFKSHCARNELIDLSLIFFNLLEAYPLVWITDYLSYLFGWDECWKVEIVQNVFSHRFIQQKYQ